MIQAIYIEEAVRSHPRTAAICARLPQATRIPCQRYSEVFNRKGQNFRLQKRRPALILAHKFDAHVLEAPPGYGIGGQRNYYFSHMLNCIYDCRYCFLQGMYPSANYVVFVNYEDFQRAIQERLREVPLEDGYFFSGYDCDSLAFDSVTGFVESFVPFFGNQAGAYLELRSKSSHIAALLAMEPIPNCIVAMSFTPQEVATVLEHKTPDLARRIEAMVKLQERGWKLGLRFDPLIHTEDFRQQYRRLFRQIFNHIRPGGPQGLHSVSLGAFRLPRELYARMFRLYPDEKLLAHPLEERHRMVSYRRAIEEEMVEFCTHELLKWIPRPIFFPCSW